MISFFIQTNGKILLFYWEGKGGSGEESMSLGDVPFSASVIEDSHMIVDKIIELSL